MMSKETLLLWLAEHGQLTADFEFDVHDGFDAAAEAATAVLANLPRMGFFSGRKRVDAFYSACRTLEAMIARGKLEVGEALVALSILRAGNAQFRKAVRAFERRAAGLPGNDLYALPALAQEYLAAARDRLTPLVAG